MIAILSDLAANFRPIKQLLSITMFYDLTIIDTKKRQKCRRIASNQGGISTAHPYSNSETWCIRIVTGTCFPEENCTSIPISWFKTRGRLFEWDPISVQQV